MGILLTLVLLVLAFWGGMRTQHRLEHGCNAELAICELVKDAGAGVCWLVLKAYALVKRVCQKIGSWFEEHQYPD